MYKVNEDAIDDLYCEWLEENCKCEDECDCMNIEDWIKDGLQSLVYGMDEQDYQEMTG